MIYLVGVGFFSAIILALVLFLLLAFRAAPGEVARISINDNPQRVVETRLGTTLLSALSDNNIFLPAACGGAGACGQCRCRVDAGGGDIQPAERNHLTRQEQQENIRVACQMKVQGDLRIYLPRSIFNIKKYTGAVISNRNVATFIKELMIELDNDEVLDFQPGQYVQMDIPEFSACFSGFDVTERFLPAWEQFRQPDFCSGTDEPVFRAYSLANPPYEKILRFTVRIATPPPGGKEFPPGVGSSYVFNLKAGDRVTLSGPYGDFIALESDREMCFVGGGAGMAPIRSHILHQLNTLHTRRKITFWYGARSWQEAFYYDEFRQLAERFENFSYYLALSDPRSEDNWQGLTGFIHNCLYEEYLKHHDNPAGVEYYLCGPPPMIAATEKMLAGLGVTPDMIAYDKF